MKRIIIALLLLSPFMPAMATNDVSNIENQLSEIQDRLDQFADSQYLDDLFSGIYTFQDTLQYNFLDPILYYFSNNFTPELVDSIRQVLFDSIEPTLSDTFYITDLIYSNLTSPDYGLEKMAFYQERIYSILNNQDSGLKKIYDNIKSLVDLTEDKKNQDESHNKVLKEQLDAIEFAIYQVKGALSWAEGDEDDGLAYLLRGIKNDVEKQNPFFEDYQESQGSTDSFALPEYYTFSVLNDLNKDIKEINLQSSINPEYQCQNLFDMIKQYFKRSIEMQSSDHKGLAVIARAILQTDPKQNEVEQDVKMALADAHSQMHEIQAEYSFKDLEDKVKFDQHEKYFDFDDLLDQFKFSTPNNWFSLGQVSLSDNAHLYLDFDISDLMPYIDFSRRLFTGLYFVCLAGLVWFIWNKILPFLYKFGSYIKTLFS